MMESTRRDFLSTALLGGVGAALPFSSRASSQEQLAENPNYAKLDKVLKEQIFKKELFKSPVIIDTLELLRYKDNFI